MAIYRHVSSKEILRKVFRDLKPPTADMIHDAIEWIGEALEHIGAASQVCQKNCVVTIKNHRGNMPADLYTINGVAINTCVQPNTASELNALRDQIDELNTNLTQYYESVRSTVTSNSNGQFISSLTPADLSNFDSWHATTLTQLNTLNSRMQVLETIYFNDGPCLQPLRYGTSIFQENPDCPDCPDPVRSKHTYIINCNTIQTTLAEGQICLSYTAFMTDDECYPMVPDNISYRDALFWYIVKKMLLQGLQLRNKNITYDVADMYWLKYCTQARNAANYPDMDRYQNFMDQWVRLIPNMNRDLNFFEDLNEREALQRDNY